MPVLKMASMSSAQIYVVRSILLLLSMLTASTMAAAAVTTKVIFVELGANCSLAAESCSVQRFGSEDVHCPWADSERHEGGLIRSARFSDGGLYKANCSREAATTSEKKTSFMYVFVFHIDNCSVRLTNGSSTTSSISTNSSTPTTVDEHDVIWISCVVKYAAGPVMKEIHWIPPLKWTSFRDVDFEDCRTENQGGNDGDDDSLTFTLCAKVTAKPPSVDRMWLSPELQNMTLHFKARQHIPWMSPRFGVRYAARDVTIQTQITATSSGETVSRSTCTASGFPAPSFRWLEVQTERVIDGSQLNVTVVSVGSFRLLTFTEVRVYRCVASNDVRVRGRQVESTSDDLTISVQTDALLSLSVYVFLAVAVVLLIVVLSVTINVVVLCRRRRRGRRTVSKRRHGASANKRDEDSSTPLSDPITVVTSGGFHADSFAHSPQTSDAHCNPGCSVNGDSAATWKAGNFHCETCSTMRSTGCHMDTYDRAPFVTSHADTQAGVYESICH